MKYRTFGDTGREVSEVGLGCWQIGGGWGEVSEEEALGILRATVEGGVRMFDTADVYGSGLSETLIGRFLKDCPEEIFVATKFGNMGPDLSLGGLRKFTEDSLRRLGVEALDLTQSHCLRPPTLRDADVFASLRTLKEEGKIKAFGASVESMEEAMTLLDADGLSSLQIIFNIFRQKPIDALFEKAKERNVALIVRLPLASGLLSGKFTKDTKFAPDDHRTFNEDGQRFNVGETFAGVGLKKGVELADRIKPLVPEGMSMAQMALRWILDHDAVTVVIPGASRASQAAANAAASELPPLSDELHAKLRDFYETDVARHIRGAY